MRRLEILHRTYYNFIEPVQLGPHRLLLRPREGAELRIEKSQLDTAPLADIHWLRDEYDNAVAVATFATRRPSCRLSAASSSNTTTRPRWIF